MKTRLLIIIGIIVIHTLIFDNAYAASGSLPWYFLAIAYWPVTLTIVGIIIAVIFVIWRKRK